MVILPKDYEIELKTWVSSTKEMTFPFFPLEIYAFLHILYTLKTQSLNLHQNRQTWYQSIPLEALYYILYV